MRAYLESEIVQGHVASFFDEEKPVAAICHGVLLAARSISKHTGRSVLWGYQTTALTWAFENSAWLVARVTRFWDPNYYRTYPEQSGQPKGFMSVQQEVTRALARPEDFRDVPRTDPNYRRKTSGLVRDTRDDETPAFVVRDRNYVSARWPGDAHTFAKTFADMLQEQNSAP
jgi:putative intracellular protease/amidase